MAEVSVEKFRLAFVSPPAPPHALLDPANINQAIHLHRTCPPGLTIRSYIEHLRLSLIDSPPVLSTEKFYTSLSRTLLSTNTTLRTQLSTVSSKPPLKKRLHADLPLQDYKLWGSASRILSLVPLIEGLKVVYRASDEDVLLIGGIVKICGLVRGLLLSHDLKNLDKSKPAREKRKRVADTIEAAAVGMIDRARCLSASKRERAINEIVGVLLLEEASEAAIGVARRAKDQVFVNKLAVDIGKALGNVMMVLGREQGTDTMENWCNLRWEASERSWVLLRILEEIWSVVGSHTKAMMRKKVLDIAAKENVELVTESLTWKEFVSLAGIDTHS
ncbi:hypothetical protein EX30DRAFT_396206 [Ascodesmis nigricans]|uniref:Uncharacterized protein n=1 Tax=Ascodesmis nigricans TaxID=341454 RepID=A0A4S2MV74_9PEZI|nr:hypothetical protein EX30DRAFT_396206 [Ascodesmis nigricans]